jgi:hypothetical protein
MTAAHYISGVNVFAKTDRNVLHQTRSCGTLISSLRTFGIYGARSEQNGKIMNEGKSKSTQRRTAELISLWVPTSQLPLITQFAKKRGISRTKVLLDGAKILMRLMNDTEGEQMNSSS